MDNVCIDGEPLVEWLITIYPFKHLPDAQRKIAIAMLETAFRQVADEAERHGRDQERQRIAAFQPKARRYRTHELYQDIPPDNRDDYTDGYLAGWNDFRAAAARDTAPQR